MLAALAHAGAPLTAERLATALDWPRDRVADALHDIALRPDVAGPLALRRVAPGAYTVGARPDLLTPSQREALGRPRRPGTTPGA
nr:hypothetical protein GCM10020093_016670 [Planobispora longispora]